MTGVTRLRNALRLTFRSAAGLKQEIEEFVRLEQQCCGFLTFTLTTGKEGLDLHIQGDANSAAVLDMFVDALEAQL